MLSRRSFLTLAAALASVSLLSLTAQAGPRHSGPARGAFDLPDSTNNGHMRGALKFHGHVKFILEAQTIETSATEGEIEGVLRRPNAPAGAPPFALVRGTYQTDASGQQGHFRLLILKPDPSGTNPPRRIGRINGGFHDDQPLGTAGRFRGNWRTR